MGLAALALTLITAIWALAWERVDFVQRQALSAETAKNNNLAIAHAETMAREIELVDQLLRILRDDLRQGPLPPDLGPGFEDSGLARETVLAVSQIDAEGRLVASTLPGVQPSSVNFSDRDYFAHHAGRADDRPLVGVPVLGRLTGQWVISVTRRIEQPGGGFGGVLYAAVDSLVFGRLYERSALGDGGSLALIGLDGVTRVRRNGNQLSHGGNVADSTLFEQLPQARSGHYIAAAASDGIRRTVSYRQLASYPLVVVVASSLADVRAQTRQAEQAVWAAAGGSSVLVLALAALAAYAVQRNAGAVAAMAEAEQRNRLLLDNSFDAILRTTPDGRVQAANAAACALFGCTEDGLRAAGRSGLVDTQDPRLQTLLAARAVSGRASGRLRMLRADGSAFEAEVSSILYTDTDGAAASSLTVRDLSAQLAAEAERSQFEQQRRQSQKLEAIGTLAGGIAHDFNNILAAIIGNTALLRQDLGAAQANNEALALIDRSALRARALVQQILTFSRRNPEQRQVQALQPLLLDAAAMLRSTLPAAVRLELQLPEAPLAVVCDSTQMQQVLMNLCTNAWQAMPDQRGRIDVSLRPAPSPSGTPGAVLRVQDDGEGMDATTRERLFEPFFTTKPIGKGTGLGLAVVHGIVAAHQGSIAVDSTPGRGSCFEVWLPLAASAGHAAALPMAATPEPLVPPASRRERVLYVDDDEVLAITVENLLLRAGWQVNTCSGAAQALALLRADPQAFDLVVTDFNMPDLSGLDLAEALRLLRPALPVIITSGHVSDDLLARAEALGVHQVVLKEFTLERLVPLVQHLLARTAEQPTGPP